MQRGTGLFALHRSKIVTLSGKTLGKLAAEPNWLASFGQAGRVIGLDEDTAKRRLASRWLEAA